MSSFIVALRRATKTIPSYTRTCCLSKNLVGQYSTKAAFVRSFPPTVTPQARKFSSIQEGKDSGNNSKKFTDNKEFRPHAVDPDTFEDELKQLSILQRYKKLLKDYWYILIPVHGAGSVLWFGSCFLLASSGINLDLGSISESLGLPDSIKTYLNNPNLGSLAVAIALYKLASPFRYMTTVYAVVPAIKILVRKRLIKPVPKLTSQKRIQAEISNIRNKMTKKRGE
jgi:hypothetical protein